MSVIIVDKSTRALAAAQTALTKTLTELNSGVESLIQQQTDLANDIHFKGEELKSVEAKVESTIREANAETRLRVLENEDKVLGELLSQRGLITTTPAAQKELEVQLKTAEAKAAQTEHESVKVAETALHAHYSSKLAAQESAHKVEIAELNANAKASVAEIAMLKEQLEQSREDLKAEREARVQIAQAESSRQGVVVNTTK